MDHDNDTDTDHENDDDKDSDTTDNDDDDSDTPTTKTITTRTATLTRTTTPNWTTTRTATPTTTDHDNDDDKNQPSEQPTHVPTDPPTDWPKSTHQPTHFSFPFTCTSSTARRRVLCFPRAKRLESFLTGNIFLLMRPAMRRILARSNGHFVHFLGNARPGFTSPINFFRVMRRTARGFPVFFLLYPFRGTNSTGSSRVQIVRVTRPSPSQAESHICWETSGVGKAMQVRCSPQHKPRHAPPFSTTSTGTEIKVNKNRVTNGWVACCLQPDHKMFLWILITICNLRIAPFVEMCPSKIRQKHLKVFKFYESLSCHRDSYRLFWSWDPVHS